MSPLDWAVVALYFVASAALGLRYARRAGTSVEEFFLSGRDLPWWLAGTSMVATTFAADTPLAVTELVARNGIAGNWIWWSMVFSGMLTGIRHAAEAIGRSAPRDEPASRTSIAGAGKDSFSAR